MSEDSPSVIAAAQLAREAQERAGLLGGRRRRRPRMLPGSSPRTDALDHVAQPETR